MGAFKVCQSNIFEEKLKSMPKDFKEWVEKIQDQLVLNPYVGKPLGVDWLREKKCGKYRVYYLIYEEQIIVFMVNISEKKYQQKVINTIKLFLERYKEEPNELTKK